MRQIIREEVARRGAISFARFMELALYCPNFGYYETAEAAPGRKGDFYTSVSVGPMFGELLAARFAEWLDALAGQPRQIVEAGAHDGRLAADVLRWLREHRPELAERVEYWILEPSPRRRASQEKTLGDWAPNIRWFASWEELPETGVRGVIFSNELLDAMPAHRVGWDAAKREWFEGGVAIKGGDFVWTKLEITNPELIMRGGIGELPRELLKVLPDGFTTEICPAAVDWWRRAARALAAGRLLTFDYGLLAEQFFAPERASGTLRAYHRHQVNADLLARPGEQDLTAQVNFSAIIAAGEAEGLRTEAFTSQGQFLAGIVEKNSGHPAGANEWTSAQVRQFQTLTHPEHLGQSFRTLVQPR